MNQKIAKKRLTAAICILLMLVLIFLSCIKLEPLIDFITMGSVALSSPTDVDSNFNEQVINTNQISADDIKQSLNHKVVGFSLYKNAEDSFLFLKEKLLDNGWNFFESQSNTCGSFYKDGGDYSWLFLNCVSQGNETSVVITTN